MVKDVNENYEFDFSVTTTTTAQPSVGLEQDKTAPPPQQQQQKDEWEVVPRPRISSYGMYSYPGMDSPQGKLFSTLSLFFLRYLNTPQLRNFSR